MLRAGVDLTFVATSFGSRGKGKPPGPEHDNLTIGSCSQGIRGPGSAEWAPFTHLHHHSFHFADEKGNVAAFLSREVGEGSLDEGFHPALLWGLVFLAVCQD